MKIQAGNVGIPCSKEKAIRWLKEKSVFLRKSGKYGGFLF